MPNVIGVFLPGGTGTLSGKVFIGNEDFSALQQLYWPSGINSLARHGSGYVYGNRNYLAGAWSSNLLVDEHFRLLRNGIIPPQSPPSVSVGGGATEQIAYLSFYDAYTDQRSSLSEGTTLNGNTTRTWTNLPTVVPGEAAVVEGTSTATGATINGTSTNYSQMRPGDRVADASAPTLWAKIRSITDDQVMVIDNATTAWAGVTLLHRPQSRCTHIELWVSVAGTLPRLASRVPLGVTGFVESVGTLSLGEAFIENFEPMPFGTMSVTYGDRQIIAGNPQDPSSLFLSNLFEHEQWGGLSFKTRFGEPIVGLVKMRDYVLVLCPESSYTLQGYTEDDLEFRVNEPDLGGMGHTCNMVIRGRAYIPNALGYFMYNGAWHSILESNLGAWQRNYLTFRQEYSTGLVAHDKVNHTLLFIPNYDEESTYNTKTFFEKQEMIVWSCDYTALTGAEAGGVTQPNWGWDDHFVEGAEIKSACYLAPATTALGNLYKITIDGKVWKEVPNVAGPQVEIVTPHYYFGDVGGDVQKGKTLHQLNAYYYGDYATCDIEVYAGENFAYGSEIRQRQEAAGVPGSLGQPVRWPTLRLSDTNGGSAIAPTEMISPPEAEPPSVAAEGSIDWIIWQARTVLSWRTGDKAVTGKGFTFKFIFTNHRMLEWYGLGGYYGPGQGNRPLNWVQFGG